MMTLRQMLAIAGIGVCAAVAFLAMWPNPTAL